MVLRESDVSMILLGKVIKRSLKSYWHTRQPVAYAMLSSCRLHKGFCVVTWGEMDVILDRKEEMKNSKKNLVKRKK